jgi:hypothetical protein
MIENPGGRPSEFDEAAPKIIEFIRKGSTYKCAAGCARLSYSTFANWISQGKESLENGDLDCKYLKFLKDVEQAERECEFEVMQCWKTFIPMSWQASRDFLARRHPEDWGAKEQVDVTSKGEQVGRPVFLPMKKADEQET